MIIESRIPLAPDAARAPWQRACAPLLLAVLLPFTAGELQAQSAPDGTPDAVESEAVDPSDNSPPVLVAGQVIALESLGSGSVLLDLADAEEFGEDPDGDAIGWVLVGDAVAEPAAVDLVARIDETPGAQTLDLTLPDGYVGQVELRVALLELTTSDALVSEATALLTIALGSAVPEAENELDTEVIGVPRALAVERAANGSITLSWQAPAGDPDGVVAYRVSGGAIDEAIVRNALRFIDTAPASDGNGRLVYSVAAIDADDQVGEAALIDATDLIAPDPVPDPSDEPGEPAGPDDGAAPIDDPEVGDDDGLFDDADVAADGADTGDQGAGSEDATADDGGAEDVAVPDAGVATGDGADQDVSAGLAPLGLRLVVAGEQGIVIEWESVAEADGYRVLRDGEPFDGTGLTRYVDADIDAGRSYGYAVAATFPDGTVSAYSPALAFSASSLQTIDLRPPTAPSDVVAVRDAAGVSIRWTASDDDTAVAGYDVYRDGNYFATTAATSFVDAGAPEAATTHYEVVGFDASGNHSIRSRAVFVLP